MTTPTWETPRPPVARRGLRESLEEFAARLGVSPAAARVAWRIEGIRFLFQASVIVWRTTELLPELCARGLCAVAPTLAVPTRPVDWSDEWDS